MPVRPYHLAAASLFTFALAVPAHADDGVWKVGQGYVVRFEKLDLTNPADRQTLLAQVERATKKVCKGERTRARRASCAEETLSSIRASIDPGLRASLDVARFERDGIQQAAR